MDAKKYWGLAGLGVLAMLISTSSVDAAKKKKRLRNWETLFSERYGFQIAYPGNVFSEDASRTSEAGQVLISRDGGARLVVATFENDQGTTLEEYRTLLLEENYQGADIDFAPRKRRGFILSGTQGDMHFYERVTFTCGGRLINSWALLYPVKKRRFYDRVVEAIAPTYSPGAGRTGECD